MIDIVYVDGAKHDLSKDYELLDEKSPFLITTDSGDDIELDSLASDIKSILGQINSIESGDIKKKLTQDLIDSVSIQMGEDIKTIADLEEFIATHKRANEYVEKEKEKAKETDFSSLMSLDTSEMVDTDSRSSLNG